MKEEKREQALLAIAKDPNRFVKTNPIINAKFDITAIQMKVFLKVIASVDQSSDDSPLVSISVKEFQKFLGGKAKNIYKYLEAELSKLRKKDIVYEDDRIKLEASFFSSIEYKKKEGYFEFEFSKKIKPFLLQIKENFTILDIRNLLYLDSIYAIRFYEFCKEYERFKGFEFEVDELKAKFGLLDRYKNYFDFKLKVLNQARTELMKNSELYFDFEEIKQGKKVVRLKFKIIKNKSKIIRPDENLNDEQGQIIDIYHTVKDYVSQETVITWFKKFPYNQIYNGIEYTLNKYKKGQVKDMPSYLQKMVAISELSTMIENEKDKKVVRKQQIQEAEKIQMQAVVTVQQQQDLKADYFEKKKQLAVKLLKTQPNLFAQLMQTLKAENSVEKPNLLTELAFNNYKQNPALGIDSIDEFLYNFNEGGIFQSYIFEKLHNQFNQFETLKAKFLPKAQALALKANDLF